jgi:molecular chaperone HscB
MENYFELLQIKPMFHHDADHIRKQFEAVSARYKSESLLQPGEAAQTEAEHLSEMTKLAYKILNDRELLMAYILKLNGVLEEGEQYELDPDFLIEMMELDELVTEYELEPGDELLKNDAAEALKTEMDYWEEEVAPLFKKFDEGDRSRELLLEIKDYYFRKKFLSEVEERMK